MPNTESATDFLQVLNSVHPRLSFTMELEQEGSIPFLGTVLTRCDGILTTEVYRKSIYKGLLSAVDVALKMEYKKDLVNTMVNRAYRLFFTKKVLTKNATN